MPDKRPPGLFVNIYKLTLLYTVRALFCVFDGQALSRQEQSKRRENGRLLPYARAHAQPRIPQEMPVVNRDICYML